jgi:hypothetical protein
MTRPEIRAQHFPRFTLPRETERLKGKIVGCLVLAVRGHHHNHARDVFSTDVLPGRPFRARPGPLDGHGNRVGDGGDCGRESCEEGEGLHIGGLEGDCWGALGIEDVLEAGCRRDAQLCGQTSYTRIFSMPKYRFRSIYPW